MRRCAAALLTLLLAAACADRRAEREAFLSSLIGKDESDVVRIMGVPARSVDAGGKRFLAYDDQRSVILPPPPQIIPLGAAWGWGAGPWVLTNPFPTDVLTFSCETVLEFADGRLSAFQLHGNGCD